MEIANENPPFPRERFRVINRFSPHPTVKRPSFRSATRSSDSSRSGTCRGTGRTRKARGLSRTPHTARSRRSRACPRIALGSRRARDRPRRPRERTPSRRAPPRLPRRVAPRASLVAVGRNRHLLPYRSRERSRGARRDEHRVRVRDGGGQGPPHGEVLDGLRGLEGASHDARGTARTTRAFVQNKGKGVSLGGVGVRRSFFAFARARRGVACVSFFFFFSQPSRARTELHDADTRPPKEKNERS